MEDPSNHHTKPPGETRPPFGPDLQVRRILRFPSFDHPDFIACPRPSIHVARQRSRRFRVLALNTPGREALHPTGEALHPTGEALHPTGEALHPTGEALHPTGEALHPTGEALHPTGEALHPTGKALHPTGEALHPTGEALHPTGEALHPTGEALHPTGEALHPTGEPCIRRGRRFAQRARRFRAFQGWVELRPSPPCALAAPRRAISPTSSATHSAPSGPKAIP
jgi:hypothetical protein